MFVIGASITLSIALFLFQRIVWIRLVILKNCFKPSIDSYIETQRVMCNLLAVLGLLELRIESERFDFSYYFFLFLSLFQPCTCFGAVMQTPYK